MNRQSMFAVLLLASTCVNAQAYRWVDDKGRIQFSDRPPASVKPAKKAGIKVDAPTDAEQPLPFEVQQAQKDFPVTLFTAPICKQPCEMARATLNKRGVPFTEIQVWNPETLEQLKSKVGSDSVPAIIVGRSAQGGFDPARYDALLDSAGYPKQGAAPVRTQSAPPPPEGYQPPPQAEPVQAEASSARPGPYDTSGLPANRIEKPGQYDTSKLPANRVDKPGPYQTPGATK